MGSGIIMGQLEGDIILFGSKWHTVSLKTIFLDGRKSKSKAYIIPQHKCTVCQNKETLWVDETIWAL